MYNDIAELKEKNSGSFKTLFKIYWSNEKIRNDVLLLLSIGLSLILTLLSIFSSSTSYDIVQRIIDISLNILPSLSGFNLGAYILIVGFGGTEILYIITKPLKGQEKFSLYQKLTSIMGVSVLIQIGTLTACFFLKISDKIQEGFAFNFSSAIIILGLKGLNLLALFFILFLVFYCFLILLNVIKQVFIFSQTVHFAIYLVEP